MLLRYGGGRRPERKGNVDGVVRALIGFIVFGGAGLFAVQLLHADEGPPIRGGTGASIDRHLLGGFRGGAVSREGGARRIASSKEASSGSISSGFVGLKEGVKEETETGDDAVTRGAYLARIGGCITCHMDPDGGEALSGGRALETPYGTFYVSNISPDPDAGIGSWTLEDFQRALTKGKSPSGRLYWPSFPYASFTKMSDGDISDLWAYLRTTEVSAKKNREHDLPIRDRLGVARRVWRLFAFRPGPLPDVPGKDDVWRRGRYLVEALAHCGECHTPRTKIGALRRKRALAGAPYGIDGYAPNITPHERDGIGRWSDDDLETLLTLGMKPDGDFVSGSMAEIVEYETSKLHPDDVTALIAYLRSIEPLPSSGERHSDKHGESPADEDEEEDGD